MQDAHNLAAIVACFNAEQTTLSQFSDALTSEMGTDLMPTVYCRQDGSINAMHWEPEAVPMATPYTPAGCGVEAHLGDDGLMLLFTGNSP